MATTYLTQTDPNKKDQIGFDPAAMNNWIDYVGTLGQAHGQLSGMNSLENNSLATTGHALNLIDYNNYGNVLAATQDPRAVAAQIIAGTYKPAVAASTTTGGTTTGATTGATTAGTTTTTTTTGGTTAAAAPAPISPDAGLNAMARNLTPAEMAQLQAQGPWGVAGGLHFTQTGSSNGGDGETNDGSVTGIEADEGNVNGITGGWKNLYNADGTFDKQELDPGASGFDKAFDAAVQMGLAAAFGGVAMGAAGIGGAAADSSLAVQGDSINALDAQTGVGYGSEANGSLLTGPTSVNADYSLAGGTGLSPEPGMTLEGNAGQGINLAKPTGDTLTMSDVTGRAPNLDAMGGGQGLTTAEGTSIGDPNSFINDPAYRLDGANGTVGETGVTAADHLPDLGDPNSFINGGTAPPPTTFDPFDSIKSFFTGGGTGGISTLTSALQAGSLIGSLLGGTSTQPTPTTPTFTPPQPQTGPTDYTNANAQGGASGSMAGVAGTLLTSKDTFGYGKSMLT